MFKLPTWSDAFPEDQRVGLLTYAIKYGFLSRSVGIFAIVWLVANVLSDHWMNGSTEAVEMLPVLSVYSGAWGLIAVAMYPSSAHIDEKND